MSHNRYIKSDNLFIEALRAALRHPPIGGEGDRPKIRFRYYEQSVRTDNGGRTVINGWVQQTRIDND